MFKSLRFTATEGIFKPPMCLLPLNQQTLPMLHICICTLMFNAATFQVSHNSSAKRPMGAFVCFFPWTEIWCRERLSLSASPSALI